MDDQIARAEEFEKKAEKNFKGWGLFSSNYEDVTYRFDKAANSFKLAKSYAIEIYEEIARHSHNNLLKYRVKCHLLNAGICHLCKSDIVAITNALERYQEMDPTFSGTREYRPLAIPAEVVVDFWKTTLLLRVKEKVKAKELEEDDLT